MGIGIIRYKALLPVILFTFCSEPVLCQIVSEQKDGVLISLPSGDIVLDRVTGTIDFSFHTGDQLMNTIAFIKVESEVIRSSDLNAHEIHISAIKDKIGKGKVIQFTHSDARNKLVQYITVYERQPFILLSASYETPDNKVAETNHFSPLAITHPASGYAFIKGKEPRLMDMPFDNDNWTKLLTVKWSDSIKTGQGYEFTSLYDYETLHGVVIGNLTHDFWKTGIQYALSHQTGTVNSLIVYGGASSPDNKQLANEYGGYDGTHDVVQHGSMKGETLFSPLIFLMADSNVTTAFKKYGELNATISGSLQWSKDAPFYWNSFGVENVLGHRKVMMPAGVAKISDFLRSLSNFNSHNPVLSIDSYDQNVYTTPVLKSIGAYAKKRNQQMGFYLIPFAIWTWKRDVEKTKLQFTNYLIREVSLKDSQGKTIVYKDDEFGAFPLDPTHPGTRQRIVAELLKAKEIGAVFLKLDFLTAGSLETPQHFNPVIRSGLQAYNYGMKMLHHLIDSIMGPDIFITQAISPVFPSQYAHARFLSTDIFSHFRDDLAEFPHFGSTASSMITNSHLGWMQGTIIPYVNLDVLIMKNFQKNADLSERDIKARLFSLITSGSILGDGSDYRNNLAAERAKKFLNNKNVTDHFRHPRAFTPIKFSDGLSQSQQLCFYLPGDTVFVSSFNFDPDKQYSQVLTRGSIGLKSDVEYSIKDFLTGEMIGTLEKYTETFTWVTCASDARLVKFIQVLN